MTSQTKIKAHWTLVIIGTVIVCLLIISIPIGIGIFMGNPDPYEGPSSTPKEVRYNIERINATIQLDCPSSGLNDASWVCPQVTQALGQL